MCQDLEKRYTPFINTRKGQVENSETSEISEIFFRNF